MVTSNKPRQPRRPRKEKLRGRSNFEDKVMRQLDARGITYGYEDTQVPYTTTHKYIPDISLPNGILVELKGYFKPKDRTKHLRVKAENPELDIRFVFMNPFNTLSKRSKTTYAQWCSKRGFKWAKGSIPDAWISE